MKRIIVVHGWDGNANESWMPWATEQLQRLGYDVLCPNMPNTGEPKIEEWVPFLAKLAGTPDENTYFIAHSIGAQAVMRYLTSIEQKVGGAIFVAGWFDLENLEGPDEEAIAKPWLETPINTNKVKNNLGFTTAFLSDNDPFVPYEKTKTKFQNLLGAEVITVPKAGHFTSEDGFSLFPQLIEVVKKKVC